MGRSRKYWADFWVVTGPNLISLELSLVTLYGVEGAMVVFGEMDDADVCLKSKSTRPENGINIEKKDLISQTDVAVKGKTW